MKKILLLSTLVIILIGSIFGYTISATTPQEPQDTVLLQQQKSIDIIKQIAPKVRKDESDITPGSE
ncbi:MAG: hypothetical protein LBT32_03810, partial [Peptococcaceae bacterium]|nr:hypothetical protein [Peptococcaceae bacterium]